MNWLYVIVFILFFAWFDGINAKTEEQLERQTKEHARKAYLLSACLGGGALTDGQRVVDCKVRR